MDTKGIIREHSKVKLTLYQLYLQRYLSVLLSSGAFDQIIVHDIFAGTGKSLNDENGSPIIAADEIKKLKEKYTNKKIKLVLNEKDRGKYKELKKNIESFPFISLDNMDANDYIKNWRPNALSHNLFFMDPHGYTQITINNLKRLFSREHCEFLIFVPVYHIYRFLRKEENTQQLKPIADFIKDLGISEDNARSVKNVFEFSELISNALGVISDAEYVYREDIENRKSNSKYSLFFITRHILGAEKFLEAQAKLKKTTKSEYQQLSLDFLEDNNEKSILNYIKADHQYDNVQLYKLGILNKIHKTKLNAELRTLEKENKIDVKSLYGKIRNNKGFYINYTNYKNKERKISVTLKG